MCFNIITIIKYILTKIGNLGKDLIKIGARIIGLAGNWYSIGKRGWYLNDGWEWKVGK